MKPNRDCAIEPAVIKEADLVNIDDIRKNMPVLDAGGNNVGTVGGLYGAFEIQLARRGAPDGLHHYIPMDWVEAVDTNVHLKRTGSDAPGRRLASAKEMRR